MVEWHFKITVYFLDYFYFSAKSGCTEKSSPAKLKKIVFPIENIKSYNLH